MIVYENISFLVEYLARKFNYMNQNIYLGLDLGTTVLKLTAISDSGIILDTKSKELSIDTPKPGWAEEHPLLWFETFHNLFKEIALTVPLKNVKAIGISGQMHGLIAYSKEMKILRPAIIWADKRSIREVKKINELIGHKKIYTATGNPLFTGFLLPSLLWLKKNEARLYKKISKISSPKDYIAYQLTGNLFSEPTDGLATASFDYKKNNWAHEILNKIGIDTALFPEIITTSTPYGQTTKEISKLLQIPEGIPVYGASDQAMVMEQHTKSRY
ncbi:MAG: FGGY family carbohydrate kinase [bacterium]|nr:FGGY family carbohydrate kinase [bacterium]